MSSRFNPKYYSDFYLDCKTEEEKARRARLLDSSTEFAEVLAQIINRRQQAVGSPRESNYDSAAWMYRLAHRQGQLEEIDFFFRLLRPFTNPNQDQ